MDGVAKRKREPAFGGFDAVRPDMLQAFSVLAEPGAPPGLDGAGGCVLDQVDEGFPAPFGNLVERRLERRRGARIPVPIERHVGQAAVRGDGRGLSLGELKGRHVDRRIRLRIRRNPVLDGYVPAHCMPSS